MLGQKSELKLEKLPINRDHMGTQYPGESDTSFFVKTLKITTYNDNNNNNNVKETINAE
jgi:hypothetical protein